MYCLVTNKTRTTYDRILRELKNLITSSAPERILVDFEIAALTAFREAYPMATVSGCYFHLNQSIISKVNELEMKDDYEKQDELRGSVRCKLL